jgi:hypothetical protein
MSGRIEDRVKALTVLPDIEPPAEAEPRTLAAMARAAEARQAAATPRFLAQAAGWLVAIGAGVWLSVWLLIDRPPELVGAPADAAVAAAATDAVGSALAANAAAISAGSDPSMEPIDEFYSLLVEESMRLEQLLALMPAPRRVMRADTASTIVSLEDRVALIDAALSGAGTQADIPEYRTALMLGRVEVMNALVNVRYAQSRAFVF